MTLLDLLKLMRRSWLFIVAMSLAAYLGCMTVLVLYPKTYEATSSVIVSNNLTGGVQAIADSLAKQAQAEGLVEAAAYVGTSANTVSIRVKGESADTCISFANTIAEKTRVEALDFYALQLAEKSQMSEGDKVAPLNIISNDAQSAQDVSPSKTKYGLIGLLVGFFVSLCILVVLDTARGTLHSAESIEETYQLNCLGVVGGKSARETLQAESLLAAVHFACKDTQKVCVIPVDNAASADEVAALLVQTANGQSGCVRAVEVLNCSELDNCVPTQNQLLLALAPPVSASAQYAYIAPACGQALLVIDAFTSRRAPFEEALRQLALSQTLCAGFVLVEHQRR